MKRLSLITIILTILVLVAPWPQSQAVTDMKATVDLIRLNSNPPQLPEFKLPYSSNAEVYWTGGPHGYLEGGNLPGKYPTGQGSGLDFANGSNFEVLAMASGTVEDASCGNGSFGCQVAIRHDVGSTVLVYAHFLEGSTAVTKGTHVSQGAVIAKAGKSGGQTKPHLHIELRDGNSSCSVQCLPGRIYGNPIGWDDLVQLVDGYKIGGYLADPEGLESYNYDGSAVKGDVSVLYNFPYIDPGYGHRHTIARVGSTFQCDPASETCEDNNQSPLTQFAGNGIFSAGGGVEVQTRSLMANSIGGQLVSSNVPEPPPPPPPPPSVDNATFLADVTLPDGSVAMPGEALHKVWRVRNSGTSTWDSGYQLVFTGGDQMGAPSAVSVPGTVNPGETVDLAVDMTAPSNPGHYIGHWRLRNAGSVYFGDELWVDVHTQGTSAHITALVIDPPSPSNAAQVYIRARVEDMPSFRAMRLLIDGIVKHETAAKDLSHTWETSGYASGEHSIVIEAADVSDPSWSHPERRGITYLLLGSQPANHAPYPPTQISPGDWHVSWDGQPPELCASHNGDPDGDPVSEYYFDVTGPQTWNSGWTANDCVTPSGLGYHTYGWKVRVRDSHNAESEWSAERRFTLVDQTVTIPVMYFDPSSPSANDDVQLFAESEGCGDMVTMRASVNTANDGTDSGEWISFYELGLSHIEPIWPTRPFSDGTHLVRVEARGCGADWEHSAVRTEPYTLLHRRPAEPILTGPMDGQFVNNRTVTFLWEETIRAQSYHLQVSTNPDPAQSPILDVTLPGGTLSYVHTFDEDHEPLYWHVGASNDVGTSYSAHVWSFGIDRASPDTSVSSLPSVSFEPQFSVSWGGTDAPAGIQYYDVQHRDGERGDWVDWIVGVDSTVALFRGHPGHTYYFRSRALDNAQNQESYPSTPDTFTFVDPTQRPPSPWWNPDYGLKHDVTILNNDSLTMWPGHPVNLHFDDTTEPTAAELYTSSLSTIPGDDFRIAYENGTELDRYVQRFSASEIDIWFDIQVEIPGLGTDTDNYQLYYGNPGATNPPGDINEVFQPGTDANTVGLWHFQEGVGNTIHDSSGRGHDGTLHNGLWMMSGLGRAIDFDGTNTYIEVPSHSDFNMQHYTLEAWIWYPEYVGANKILYRSTDPPDSAPVFGMETSSHKIRVEACAAPLESQHDISTGRWVHVAGTFDGSQLRVYLNGELDRQGNSSCSLKSSNQLLGIGFNPNNTVQNFYGRMQHVRISNVVRTSFPYASQRPVDIAPSTAIGEVIEPPQTGTPDLVIEDLTTFPSPIGGIIVQAVVRNQGDASTTNGFYSDLYADHLPTGPGDLTGSVHFWIASPIEAGSTVTLTSVLTDLATMSASSLDSPNLSEEALITLYSQADSEGVITEPDEADNISSGVDVCLAAADAYEEDDTIAEAQSIVLDETQHHNFNAIGDQDWIKFTAQSGVTYTIGTSNLGAAADTYLYLYDTDGSTLRAANDDHGGSLASQVEWMAPASGNYYLLVKHWNPNVTGCGTQYDVSISLAGIHKIYLPLVSKG